MADILASTSTTATFAVNGFGGFSSIETAGDQDWWKITLVAGSAYTFRLNALSFGGLSDPLLRLLDASGRQLALNDDAGGSLNSAINFTATQSGDYFLSAQGYGSSTGNYVISAYTAPVLPVLDISATSASKAEGTSGSTPFTFTVTRSGSTTGSSTVNWSVAGGTASASDFTGGVLPTGTLTFAAGETSKLITINVAGDSQIEGDEDFKVVLSEATGATIGTTAAIGTILNDDTLPVVSIAATSAIKAEGNSGSTPFTFTLTRSGNLTVASTVGWAVAAGTASASDFTGGVLPTGSVSFAVGEASKIITVNVAGDLLIEADETFRVNLTTATGATLGTASATGTILNDDILPVISLITTSVSKAEGNSGSTPFAFTVTRSGNTSGVSYVSWNINEVSPGLNPDDFVGGVTSGSLSFAAGETSKVITVNVAGDTAFEDNEIFNLELTTVDGATLGNRMATGTIVNDDALPTLAIAATSASKAEGNTGTNTPFTFTITRSGSSGIASSVNWSVAAGTATASDFVGGVLPSGSVSFAVGETSKVITVNVAGDALVEANETFTVNISGATGATITTAAATGTILNDDALPTLAIAATSASKAEGNTGTSTPFTFTITRSGSTGLISSVNWSVAAGTATASDFVGGVLPSGSVSFAVGETSKVITVNVAGDALVEANETFTVNLAGASGATITTAAATGTILNDDTLPTLAIAATSASKAEGNTGTTPFTFTVTRTGNLNVDSAALWRVSNISTTALDFTGGSLQSGTIGFSPGETTKTITVNVAGDWLVEGDETFNVTLSSVSGATLGTATATGTILNDDALPTLAVAATSASKSEGNSGSTPFTFTVTRSGNIGIASSVNWSVAGGTATASDFVGGVLPSGSVSFAVGETSKVITVNVAGDNVFEANETFGVTLSGASGATIATATATGTILNDDVLDIAGDTSTTSTLTINGASATSAIDFAGDQDWFRVNLTAGTTYTFALDSTSVGGLGDPYLRLLNSTGSTVATDDDSGSGYNSLITYNATTTGTYYLSAQGYGSSTGSYNLTGTALTQPSLSITATSASKAEGNTGATTPFTFTVTRSGNTIGTSSVNWSVGGGSATAADFVGGVSPSGTLTFAAGETSKVITVNVAGDNVFESDEIFGVTLSGASGATIATATAVGTILNDDMADIAGDTSTTATLTVNGTSATSAIDFAGDQDWFRINLTAGTTYAFTLDAASTGGLGDAYLRLLNSTGSALAEDDDSGGSYNSRITYTATTSGTYYLSAQGYGTNTGNYVLGAVSLAQPSLSIVANNTSQAEGNSGSTPFVFTVTRAGNTSVTSSVNWAVNGGTATASDFTGGVLPSGTLSFAAGETSKTITVNVAGDTTIESDETFSVVLSGASNATLGTASASCTIVNDDASTLRAGIDRSIASTSSFTVPSTLDPSIDNLVGSTKWGGALGTGASLTYSFSSSASVFTYTNTFNGLDAHSPYTALSSLQQTTARQAMASVAAICNLTFTEVADTTTSAGDIRWTVTQSPNEGTADGYLPTTSAAGGDIWLNSSDYTNPQAGNYAYVTFIHELGHTMGLGHPHTGTPAPEAGEDQLKYSVMSYRSYDGAPLTGYSTSYYPVDYMLNDIAALQYLYGANTSYNSGNNVYSWTANSRIYDCIWDGGGNDTIDASNQTQAVTLNLNPGTWSSIGTAFNNGSTSVRNDLGIAYGVTIENAKGTALADTLIGNAADNRLFGGGGADTLTGGAGADDFVFVVASDGGDVINDFSVAEGDAIQVIASNFGLVAGASAILRTGVSLPGAASAAGEFLYNSTDGQLWFDQDGTGSGAAVQLATLATRPTLTAGSIQLVAS